MVPEHSEYEIRTACAELDIEYGSVAFLLKAQQYLQDRSQTDCRGPSQLDHSRAFRMALARSMQPSHWRRFCNWFVSYFRNRETTTARAGNSELKQALTSYVAHQHGPIDEESCRTRFEKYVAAMRASLAH